jgi:formylmethanofuran dehydrogenase subunit E
MLVPTDCGRRKTGIFYVGWRQETCEVEALVLALKKIGFFCDFCYVEMDRCTADAVAHVKGVKPGRRCLKFVNYGIMAATFVNLERMKWTRCIFQQANPGLCMTQRSKKTVKSSGRGETISFKEWKGKRG